MELYKNKWVNPEILIDSKSFITVGIGGRGIGKTYGCLRLLYERSQNFIYVRRTQTQLDETTIQALNPYNVIASDLHTYICTQRLGKHSVGFFRASTVDGKPEPEPDPFAVGVALSTFSSIRGLSLPESFDTVVFDEIIPERHERIVIKEEGAAFLNMIESLNRNRELKGLRPMHFVLLSNSNTINSQILQAIGALKDVEEMSRRGQTVRTLRGGLVEVILFKDSPISKEKEQTALYQIANNADFSNMSLDNKFARADYEHVASKPLQEYNLLVSIGNITICRHKSKREYYVIEGVKAKEHFSITPISIKTFKSKYNYIFPAYLKSRMFFQTAAVKIEFERIAYYG
jgi:hypothetical protein